MKEYLTTRGEYIINDTVRLSVDQYNDTMRTKGIFEVLANRSDEISESVSFFSDHIEAVEDSIDTALTVIEDRISYLSSSVIHLNKLKLAAPSTASEVDIKLIDMTSGRYSNTTYSSSDGGLIMSSINTLSFRER